MITIGTLIYYIILIGYLIFFHVFFSNPGDQGQGAIPLRPRKVREVPAPQQQAYV